MGEKKLYNVHVYPVIRIKFSGVAASTPEDAMAIVEGILDVNDFIDLEAGYEVESAEEITSFMVDTLDDDGQIDCSKAQWYEADGKTKTVVKAPCTQKGSKK